MKKKYKKDEVNFYDVFKIGVEVEGEFVRSENEISDIVANTNVKMDYDGSVRGYFGGNCYEMRSDIIRTTDDEDSLLDVFRKLEKEAEEQGRKQFAYSNSSAGTHIHFSFNDDFARKLEPLNRFKKDNYLYIFDSVDFEKYFFQRYFKAFRLTKFWNRLSSEYCRPFIEYGRMPNGVSVRIENSGANVIDDSLLTIESKKGTRRQRYSWLNTECLAENEGFELRIYPHVITAKGLQDIIEFTKEVLVAYWVKKKAQRLLPVVKDYFDVKKNYTLHEGKLKKYDLVLFRSLYGERERRFLSMDFMEFYCHLFNKNKGAFEERENNDNDLTSNE